MILNVTHVAGNSILTTWPPGKKNKNVILLQIVEIVESHTNDEILPVAFYLLVCSVVVCMRVLLLKRVARVAARCSAPWTAPNGSGGISTLRGDVCGNKCYSASVDPNVA